MPRSMAVVVLFSVTWYVISDAKLGVPGLISTVLLLGCFKLVSRCISNGLSSSLSSKSSMFGGHAIVEVSLISLEIRGATFRINRQHF